MQENEKKLVKSSTEEASKTRKLSLEEPDFIRGREASETANAALEPGRHAETKLLKEKKKSSEESAGKKKTSQEGAGKTKTSAESAGKKKTSLQSGAKKKASEESAGKKKASSENGVKKKASEESAGKKTVSSESGVKKKASEESGIKKKTSAESGIKKKASEESEIKKKASAESGIKKKTSSERSSRSSRDAAQGHGVSAEGAKSRTRSSSSERTPKSSQTKYAAGTGKSQQPIALFGAILTLALCIGLVTFGVKIFHLVGDIRGGTKEEAVPIETGTNLTSQEETAPAENLSSAQDLYADKPQIDPDSWEFLLANPTHSVEDYVPPVEAIEDIYLDSRIIEPMQEFVQAARDEGLSVLLASGYRSYDEQSWLFDMQVEMYGDEEEAATIVARPGTSEHQTGLAADITDDYYEIKNDELENTELYKWMSTHCQDYGFIVRFPKGKENVTGIIYEPWHFRYVGKEAASYITSHGLTLEEFLGLYVDLEATANVSAPSTGNSSLDSTDESDSANEPLKADPFGIPVV